MTKAISIQQPWAWLIANGHKDIENRTWPTKYRGLIYIHASRSAPHDQYFEAKKIADKQGIELPDYQDLPRGGIIGRAEIVDCVQTSGSPWFFGPYGFVLDKQSLVGFMRGPGQLGIFNVKF